MDFFVFLRPNPRCQTLLATSADSAESAASGGRSAVLGGHGLLLGPLVVVSDGVGVLGR